MQNSENPPESRKKVKDSTNFDYVVLKSYKGTIYFIVENC